jgi:hydrogenase maturation protein HypF
VRLDRRRPADGRRDRLSMSGRSVQHRTRDRVQRRRLHLRGLVQGVGFRPHVYRLAQCAGLSGFVQNGPDGVCIEVEGSGLDAFLADLETELPALARIDSLRQTDIPTLGDSGFAIRATAAGPVAGAAIPADTAPCPDCLTELFTPDNRRYQHPFIACTQCGPRYTMTERLPYDRRSTAMAPFALCEHCDDEYRDPADRRFHAEPVCCHECGPRLSHPVAEIATALAAGGIVALKGLGGFHLACDARDAAAVQRLRTRKQRDGKPFAVMVLNSASAALYAQVGAAAARQLESPQRPVVVMQGRDALPEAVSPGLDTLGLILPYTPVHYLLFHALLGQPAGHDWLQAAQPTALVMTSANLSGDPLVCDNTVAQALSSIADLIVTHDRRIAARADDSMLRIAAGRPLMIRRARGYAPNAVPAGGDGPTVLATGAHLKNTLALARGEQAWLSPHIGDLSTPATRAFQEEAGRFLLEIAPETPAAIACDWHRDYASTRLAERLADEFAVPLVRVQHHHAHLAAVLACHEHAGPALGIALDGHGLGAGGESWGGELLLLEGEGFVRLGHFAPLPAPGGDAAAREPWRMAAGVLHRLGRGGEIAVRFGAQPHAAALAALLAGGEVGHTSAAGRLFDAAAGLLGVSERAAFEGEPPMLLESLVREPAALPGAYGIRDGVLDFSVLLDALADCRDPARGADWLHGTVLAGLEAWAVAAAERTGIRQVALAGGCFLNRYLATCLPQRLLERGLTPLLPGAVPPNDGSISLGQTWVARRVLDARKPPLEVLD